MTTVKIRLMRLSGPVYSKKEYFNQGSSYSAKEATQRKMTKRSTERNL